MASSTASRLGAHPRSRGENLEVGLLGGGGLGLIPAHAGKTLLISPTSSGTWAHPRSRGENRGAGGGDKVGAGSSPLTRGKQRQGPPTPRVRGSSPLTRGKLFICSVSMRRTGLIPAHAGKTRCQRRSRDPDRAHPRSRGENALVADRAGNRIGSSPLTRGKQVGGGAGLPACGLIPAHAGKTSRSRVARMSPRAHPRSRGENLVKSGHEGGRDGLIPAHAGKTPSSASKRSAAPAHPRSRGENPREFRVLVFGFGSSPLTRGKPDVAVMMSWSQGLIPAHAGKTPGAANEWSRRGAHPRSRGENCRSSRSR